MPLSPRQGNTLRLRETRNGSAQFSFCLIADNLRDAGQLMLFGIFCFPCAAPEHGRLGYATRGRLACKFDSTCETHVFQSRDGRAPPVAIGNVPSTLRSSVRGHSSVGRAPALQAGCQGFESPCLHSATCSVAGRHFAPVVSWTDGHREARAVASMQL